MVVDSPASRHGSGTEVAGCRGLWCTAQRHVHGLRRAPARAGIGSPGGVRSPSPEAPGDRAAQHRRSHTADVGSLGRHGGLPGRPGVYTLVPPAASTRRDGPALRGHAHPALLAADDRDDHDPEPAEHTPGHPVPDDLHDRVQTGPPDRADLGPDDRLHGDRHDDGGPLRRRELALPLEDGGPDDPGYRAARGGVSEEEQHHRSPSARGAGRSAPNPDGSPCADQGVVDLPRLPRHAAHHGNRHRSRAGAAAAQPHRGSDACDCHLALRVRAGPL